MNSDDRREQYNLGEEIEKSRLIRGEYDQVFATRGLALLIFVGLIIFVLVIGFLFNSTGSELGPEGILLLVGGGVVAGFLVILFVAYKLRS